MERKNNHSEPELTSEEIRLEQLLPEALGVTPPSGLVDRVEQASINSLTGATDPQFEQQLDVACSYPCPKDLASTVYAASVASLPNSTEFESEVVIARIGKQVHWQQVALAACLTFAALVAIRLGVTTPETTSVHSAVAFNGVLSIEEEELLLEDLNLSEFAYLTDTRELAFADVAASFNSIRDDIELWRYGLLTE